mmetsp:Transcript_5136/g.18656  ORF Transcript_5136/g.18656 Transcript_5136/m.18656 type:complete len:500 (-) Transcript_5136:76-1575(-)
MRHLRVLCTRAYARGASTSARASPRRFGRRIHRTSALRSTKDSDTFDEDDEDDEDEDALVFKQSSQSVSFAQFVDAKSLARALQALRNATDVPAATKAAEWIDKAAGDSARRMEAAQAAAMAFIEARQSIPSDVARQVSEALASTAASRGDIGWLRSTATATIIDGTKEFEGILALIESKGGGSVLMDEYAYLLVPGLYGCYYPGYYDDVRDAFAAYGVECRTSSLVDGEGTVETNAAAITREVEEYHRETGKKIILIGHSKGGIDCAAALAMYDDVMRNRVVGLIAVQCPYGGSPIATDLLSEPLAALTTSFLEALLGAPRGDGARLCAPIADLTYAARQKFLKKFPLPEHYAVVSFHSATTSPAAGLWPAASYTKNRYGEDSDGLVARCDASIPGAVDVRLDSEQDHADCVFPAKHAADLFTRHAKEQAANLSARQLAGFSPIERVGPAIPPPVGVAIVSAQRALGDALPERLKSSPRSVDYHEALVGVLLRHHRRA